MVVGAIFVVSAAVVALTLLGHVPALWALPAIGVVVAVLTGYMMRRGSGPGGP
jgi:hypothetical protein